MANPNKPKETMSLQKAFEAHEARMTNTEGMLLALYELNCIAINAIAAADAAQKEMIIGLLEKAAARTDNKAARKMVQSLAEAVTHGGPAPSWKPH